MHIRIRHSFFAVSLALALIAITSLSPSSAQAASIGYRVQFVNGFGCHVVQVNMGSPSVKVTPLLSLRFPGGAESMSTIYDREQPVAAMTGTFFSKTTLMPVGDIMIDGRLVHFGGMGSAIAITPGNRVSFRRIPWGRRQDWGPFETVLAGGPMLLEGGEIALAPAHEGFHDPHVLGRASRTAVGITANNKLLMVATREQASLWELAKIMRGLGCTDAINLDGGASTGMVYRGSTIIEPSRPLVNLLGVYANADPETRTCQCQRIEKRIQVAGYRIAKAHEAYMKAQVPLATGRLDEAVRHLDRAAELAPHNASYQVRLAETLARQGNDGAAAAAWTRAGQILLKKQRCEEAMAHLERALTHDPDYMAALFALPAAYRRVGRYAEARAAERKLALRDLRRGLVATHADLMSQVVSTAFSLADLEMPQQLPGPPLSGTVSNRNYVDIALGVRLQVPGCWEISPTSDPSELEMSHQFEPYVAHLRTAWAPENLMLQELVDLYWEGSFQQPVQQTPIELKTPFRGIWRTETITSYAGVHCQTVFFKRDNVLWVLSLAADADMLDEAAGDFAQIVDSFTLF